MKRMFYFVGALSLLASTSGQAEIFDNGDLTGPVGNMVPEEWSQYQLNTSDTANENGPFGTYNLSPTGGTFVRSIATDPNHPQFFQREGIVQTVSSLVIGDTYSISFFQSSVNGINSNDGQPFQGFEGFWEMLIDETLVDSSPSMEPPPGFSLDNTWEPVMLMFTATAETHVISFRATVPDGAPSGTSKTFMLIDGLTSDQNVSVAATSWGALKNRYR